MSLSMPCALSLSLSWLSSLDSRVSLPVALAVASTVDRLRALLSPSLVLPLEPGADEGLAIPLALFDPPPHSSYLSKIFSPTKYIHNSPTFLPSPSSIALKRNRTSSTYLRLLPATYRRFRLDRRGLCLRSFCCGGACWCCSSSSSSMTSSGCDMNSASSPNSSRSSG
jgi:hypothetical protein